MQYAEVYDYVVLQALGSLYALISHARRECLRDTRSSWHRPARESSCTRVAPSCCPFTHFFSDPSRATTYDQLPVATSTLAAPCAPKADSGWDTGLLAARNGRQAHSQPSEPHPGRSSSDPGRSPSAQSPGHAFQLQPSAWREPERKTTGPPFGQRCQCVCV